MINFLSNIINNTTIIPSSSNEELLRMKINSYNAVEEKIKKGRYYNKRYYKENRIRKIMKSLFPRQSFASKKPSWLINNKTGKRMEIDIFNENLKLCVEYSGIQHYKFMPQIFHKSYQQFEEQKERDLLKQQLILKNGYKYICVPYYINDIEEYLLKKLSKIL